MDQLINTKADLESYLTSDILRDNRWTSSEWVFVPMLYCEEIEQGVKISQNCEDFVIQGKYLYVKLNQRCATLERIDTYFNHSCHKTILVTHAYQ